MSLFTVHGHGHCVFPRVRRSVIHLDPDRAVSALVEYGRTVRAADPDLDAQQLRVGLQMQAQVIGVDPADLDEVLVDVLAQLFDEPQFESVADPSQPPE